MPSLRVITIAGAAALIASLVVALPARTAYQWLAPPALPLSGLSGTVWHGSASEGNVAGVYFSDLEWRLRPLALLTGRAQFSVSAVPVSGFARAELSIDPGGTMRLADVHASLPVRSLERIVSVAGVEGNLNLELPRLVVRDGMLAELEGDASVTGLVISPFGAAPLGDYRASFRTRDGTILGEVEDSAGVLDLSGTIELTPDRGYSFVGLIGSRPDAPAAIDRQLRYLGSADAEGRRRFRLEGRL